MHTPKISANDIPVISAAPPITISRRPVSGSIPSRRSFASMPASLRLPLTTARPRDKIPCMSRLVATLTALAALAAPVLSAQTSSPATLPAPAAAPATTAASCPPSATLDQLIAALNDAVTGPANKDRTCFRQILLPQVRLIPVSTPTATPRLLTIDDWIAAVAKHGTSLVTEKQIKYQSETYGNVAHLWSTYETSIDGKLATRGINSIQAVFDGQNWKIVEVLWQVETPATPVPPQYLP
jgi:hypothetical protein